MLNKIRKCSLLLMLCLFVLTNSVSAYLNQYDLHPETGYQEVICDSANLLRGISENKIESIWERLAVIAKYGNAAVVTIGENSGGTTDYTQSLYREWYGNASGIMFMIDLGNHQLYIFSDGAINKEMGRSMALTITDNVYRYASNEDYYTCILEAVTQIAEKLEGGKVAQPMRYLSAFFLAILMALIITFIMAKRAASTAMGEEKELFDSILVNQELKNARRLLIRSHISEEKSSDSDGGGSSGGGGGGGGSGSGGGHGF